MGKEKIVIELKDIENISGKKGKREIIYTYLNFQFNLHKIGDNSEGKPMYRITPINFDNMLLKKYVKKTYPAKGFSTVQASNLKADLSSIFNDILATQKKKALAKSKFERAQKIKEREENKK